MADGQKAAKRARAKPANAPAPHLRPPRAPYATDPSCSRGRLYPEPESRSRNPFERDRDRIVHASAFRRLKGKTQVFVAHEGDHYRTRLTHSLEVAQIARAVARQMGLDDDLAECLGIAHDLGHPPFGHTGEDVLDACMEPYGGFDHNAQTLRVLTKLERKYPGFDGLNLTWETLEGVVKHNGPLIRYGATLTDLPVAIQEYVAQHDLELASWPGLEAQVAAISDDIAYDNHDVDDGLRSGLLDLDALLELSLVKRLWDGIADRHPGSSPEKRQRALIRDMIGAMVEDVLAETERRVRSAGVETPEDVRSAGRALAGFSDALAAEEAELKRYLHVHLYESPELHQVRLEAERVVTNLAAAYREDPSLLPEGWHSDGSRVQQLRTIGDFVAGMTDRFAVARHEELVGPVNLPIDRF